MAKDHLISGIDYTSIVGQVTKADLLQGVQASKPVADEGFIIWADSAPDVIANPELATFLWGKTVASVPNKEIYLYLSGSWQLLPLVNGALLGDGTVPLTKLDLTGADPYEIIQVNAGGQLVYIDIPNAVQNDTISPVKLVAPDNTYNYVLTCLLGVKAFTLISDLFDSLADNTLDVSKLARAGADALGFYLRTKLDGTDIEWANVDVANLAATGYAAGQSVRRNGTNTGWEAFTAAVSGSTLLAQTLNNSAAYWDIPAPAGPLLDVPHGLGKLPLISRVVLRCIGGPYEGYVDGDEMELTSIAAPATGTTEETRPAFSVVNDVTNVRIVPNASTVDYYLINKATRAQVGPITYATLAANFKFNVYTLSN